MKTCQYCEKSVPKDAVNCPYCGKRITMTFRGKVIALLLIIMVIVYLVKMW